MRKVLLLAATHVAAVFVGFAAGIYLLPILTAPAPPAAEEVRAQAQRAQFSGEFRRDLAGSDALHWGEGRVYVSREAITLEGEISPGPAYRLYLSPEFVETEAKFERLKASMAPVGEVKTFRNFVVPVPAGVDPAAYDTVVIWCESFSQFITAARYR